VCLPIRHGNWELFSSMIIIPEHKTLFYCLTVFFLSLLTGSLTPALSQAVTRIEILNSNSMEKDEKTANAIKYIGNVIFRHDDALMYCDSAYLFPEENLVTAFHNIHIEQGDTLDLYGDYLTYNGNEKLAEITENVKLIDKENILTTHHLDYNLRTSTGYYINGGKIKNGDNDLESGTGFYYSKLKLFHFRDSVIIHNPEYNIYADTLKYNTVTEIAYFLGPTEIISKDNYIYCENGWYDTKKNVSQFNENAYLASKGQYLKGDSLYYERDTGLGKAFDNVELFDSTQNIILKGKFAIYNEAPEYALLTDSAQFMQISEKDTLYVHADTLESVLDTSGLHKILKAYYKVKIFRVDIQGKCDSLVYLESDSVFQLFSEPVLWSEENQLTADQIEIHLANKKLHYLDMTTSSFIISKEDSVKFNQIKGKNMRGYFVNNKLVRIEVKGNGQTIYYAKDKDNLIGINRAECSDLIIYLKDSKIDRINLILAPKATLYPPDGKEEFETILKGFEWLEKYRPDSKEDIFIWERN
jgi:lipopolysaccharide export system protein LptA